jgi:hypothetical protein
MMRDAGVVTLAGGRGCCRSKLIGNEHAVGHATGTPCEFSALSGSNRNVRNVLQLAGAQCERSLG